MGGQGPDLRLVLRVRRRGGLIPMPTNPNNPGDGAWVVERARAMGFALAGIADASASRYRDELIHWIDAGKHGTMQWMHEHGEKRADPNAVLEGARSAIMVADLYAKRASNIDPPIEPGQGRVARYARGRDYHIVMKKRLIAFVKELQLRFPDDMFRVFVDTAPVMEHELAQRAGIGWTGKHTLTIHPKIGSYFLLGGILSTRPFPPPENQSPVTDHCGSCTRCIDACPTDAITPYSVDARRCISYLTIEHREPIEEGFHKAIGDWIYGCDICQEVCPHNSPRSIEALPPEGRSINEAYTPIRDRFDLLSVINWTEDDRREAFRGSAMKRAKLEMMQRNAAIVLKNQAAD